ncbi:hypothetical protein LZ198_10390 [Myxococcus sp. K15C18031901]|uniref:hypothetical protein n=1 Tax=Myxococcus dinghuensis TaxID=2906761 RepID=UPI0020A72CDC|nr:hypothetical protein [Myxococcus dinghuensis]MCP3099279.1 hypothetical protein [Myxococcus dinghuensis]
MRTRLDTLSRVWLVGCLGLGLAVLLPGCIDGDAAPQESWTQQGDPFGELNFGTATYTLNNCMPGDEWDASSGTCQPTYCYKTRGPGWGGTEPYCSKLSDPPSGPQVPPPGPNQACSISRNPSWCGTEPNCYPCVYACADTRGQGWCGYEPDCYVCPACSVSRNNANWCGTEPNCYACGPSCESTRGAYWCGNEPSCYACGPSCPSTRGANWCGTEPSCYFCGNGGGTSEGG